MNYTKPEITVLGDAVLVVQGTKICMYTEGSDIGIESPVPPAYQLDE